MRQKLLVLLFALLCAAGVKAAEYNPDYFALTAYDDAVTVDLYPKIDDVKLYQVDGILEYSTDKEKWTSFAITKEGIEERIVLTIEKDQTVYFRSTLKREYFPAKFRRMFDARDNKGYLVASGNITSLLDPFNTRPEMEEPEALSLVFFGFDRLKSAKDLKLPAQTLTEGCYFSMFSGCTLLEEAPELPAKVLAPSCYSHMFSQCPIRSVELGATNATADGCFSGIVAFNEENGKFYITEELKNNGGADKLVNAAKDYSSNWSAVVVAPATERDYFALTAYDGDVTVAVGSKSWYDFESVEEGIEKFLQYSSDKSNWTTIPFVGANASDPDPKVTIRQGQTVYFRAYTQMSALPMQFQDGDGSGYLAASGNIMSLLDPTCSSTEMGEYAFSSLFRSSRKLKSAKDLKLPAMTLSDHCYFYMFQGCENLEDAPYLPATTLAPNCYKSMFSEDSKLTSVTLGATSIPEASCVDYMVSSGSGVFYLTETLYNSEDKASLFNTFNKDTWTTEAFYPDGNYFALTAKGGDVAITLQYKPMSSTVADNLALEYSKDKILWTKAVTTTKDCLLPVLGAGQTYYFRKGLGEEGIRVQIAAATENNGTLEASGNVMSLRDRTMQSTEAGMSAFGELFMNCKLLTSAQNLLLPATKVNQYSYAMMFKDCSNLTVGPAELPATELAKQCYMQMFAGCTSLQSAITLPATELAEDCYQYMFAKCNSLTEITLGATDISAPGCLSCWLQDANSGGMVFIGDELVGQIGQLELSPSWRTSTMFIHANEDPDNKGHYYTTFYDSKYSWAPLTEGAKVYYGQIGTDGNGGPKQLFLSSPTHNKIHKDVGVIVHSNTAEIKMTIVPTDFYKPSENSNHLRGSDVDCETEFSTFILSYGQDGLGFYRNTSGKLAAHKAYLPYSGSSSSYAKAITMVFDDDETTSLSGVIDNMNDQEAIYNLSGQRVDGLQKGVNVVNGKKVFIK